MEGKRIKRLKMTKKKAKYVEEGHDCLTELPEPLIHHILSYLTMEDVIRTSLLAKRWRYIWLSVPCLNFGPMKMPKYRKLAFINRSLLLHNGPKIQKLNIVLKHGSVDALQVDLWIQFASTRNVDELYLDFLCKPCCYKLPHFRLSFTSLTVLELKRCNMNFLVSFKLSSLKVISLEQVSLFRGEINDLISSSPVLEYLSLTNCKRSEDLDLVIMNVCTKTLKIHENFQFSSSSKLEVHAPFIVSLELITSARMKNFAIERMRSLESANFDGSEFHAYCGHLCMEYAGNNMFKILDNARHVKDLKLGGCFLQALSFREEQTLDFLSFDATCLQIRTDLTEWELPGIAYMLRHSPNIETLIISVDKIVEKNFHNFPLNDKSNCKFNFEDGEYWKLQEPNYVDLLRKLKTVKIYNFMKNLNVLQSKRKSTTIVKFSGQLQNDMNFLRFLLKNSKVLERMIITTWKNVNFGKSASKKLKLKLLFLLTQELLSFPRASRDAEISFS